MGLDLRPRSAPKPGLQSECAHAICAPGKQHRIGGASIAQTAGECNSKTIRVAGIRVSPYQDIGAARPDSDGYPICPNDRLHDDVGRAGIRDALDKHRGDCQDTVKVQRAKRFAGAQDVNAVPGQYGPPETHHAQSTDQASIGLRAELTEPNY